MDGRVLVSVGRDGVSGYECKSDQAAGCLIVDCAGPVVLDGMAGVG